MLSGMVARISNGSTEDIITLVCRIPLEGDFPSIREGWFIYESLLLNLPLLLILLPPLIFGVGYVGLGQFRRIHLRGGPSFCLRKGSPSFAGLIYSGGFHVKNGAEVNRVYI